MTTGHAIDREKQREDAWPKPARRPGEGERKVCGGDGRIVGDDQSRTTDKTQTSTHLFLGKRRRTNTQSTARARIKERKSVRSRVSKVWCTFLLIRLSITQSHIHTQTSDHFYCQCRLFCCCRLALVVNKIARTAFQAHAQSTSARNVRKSRFSSIGKARLYVGGGGVGGGWKDDENGS